jgi:hypothetical protein
MADPYAHLSDADLEAIAAGKQPAAAPAPAPAAAAAPHDYSHMSDADLEKIAGDKWQRASVLPVEVNDRTHQIRPAWPSAIVDGIPAAAKGIANAVTLPGDAAEGNVDIGSPEGWQRVVDFGTMIAPGARANGALRKPTTSSTPGALNLVGAGPGEAMNVPRSVVRAIKSDGIAPGDIPGKLAELGPDAVIADLGRNTQMLSSAVATMPGAGQSTVVDALTKRKAAAPDRLRGALDENLGQALVPGDVQAGLKASQRGLSPEYEAVLANAKPVDTSALAATLEQQIPGLRGEAQKAAKNVRDMLNKTGGEPVTDPAAIIAAETDPATRRELVRKHLAGEPLTTPAPLDTDARTLLATRQAIDGMVGSTQDSNVQRVLGAARKSVDATLGEAVPGIKDVDAKYANLAKTSEAFDRGQRVLGSGRETPRPTELQAEVDKANAPTMEYGPSDQAFALKQGARAEIERIVGTNLNDRAALNSLLKGEGDWNYSRLSTLFGKDRTDAIYKVLDNEHRMANTENMALAGSKTAAVQAAQKDVAPARAPGIVAAVGNLRFGDAGRDLIDSVMRGYGERRQAGRNADTADVLMSRDALQPGATGRGLRLSPTIADAIMRGSAEPTAAQRAKQRQFLNDQRVY